MAWVNGGGPFRAISEQTTDGGTCVVGFVTTALDHGELCQDPETTSDPCSVLSFPNRCLWEPLLSFLKVFCVSISLLHT